MCIVRSSEGVSLRRMVKEYSCDDKEVFRMMEVKEKGQYIQTQRSLALMLTSASLFGYRFVPVANSER